MTTLLHEQASHPAEANQSPNEILDIAEIVEAIASAKRELFMPDHKLGIKARDVIGKNLPTSPLPLENQASAEDRQSIARQDIEVYKKVIADPGLQKSLGEAWTPVFTGYSWARDGEQHTPLYTEVAALNPNVALLLTFDLDARGYAKGSSAKLLMSKDPTVLHNALSVTFRPSELAA